MRSIKYILPFMAVFCLFASSCEKKGAEAFTGSYTYKISGVVGLFPEEPVEGVDVDTSYMTLVTEQGQMNLAKGNSSNDLVVFWNDLSGDACHTTAVVDGSRIILAPAVKTAAVKDGTLTYDGSVTFAGEGEKYDNMLSISMDYEGVFKLGLVNMKVVSSRVECIAKAN